MRMRYIPFMLCYVLNGYAADKEVVSADRGYQDLVNHFDSKMLLSNASRCYNEGLYDISYNLCRAYIESERQGNTQIQDIGIKARMLLGFNFLKKASNSEDVAHGDHFDFVQNALLEICWDHQKTEACDKTYLVGVWDYAWRILAKIYIAQKEYRKGVTCLYNGLAVQYGAYNDTDPHVFPKHVSGQLRCIAHVMRYDKEYQSDILSLTAGLAEDQAWFLGALFERAWYYDDSLDAVWLLAQHNRTYENPKSEYETILHTFRLHAESEQALEREPNVVLDEVRVELLKDHPELADSYSLMLCNNHHVKRYLIYDNIKKDYLNYAEKADADINKSVFLAILRGQVIGKAILHHRHHLRYCSESIKNVGLNLFIDKAYKGKRVGARMVETILPYAQKMFDAQNVFISSNKTSKRGEYTIERVLEIARTLKK